MEPQASAEPITPSIPPSESPIPQTTSLDALLASLQKPAEEALAKPDTKELEIKRVREVVSFLAELTKREDLLKILQAISKADGKPCAIPLIQITDRDGQIRTTMRINDKGIIEYNGGISDDHSDWKSTELVSVQDEKYVRKDGTTLDIDSSVLRDSVLGSEDFISLGGSRGSFLSLGGTLHSWQQNGFPTATRELIETTLTTTLEATASQTFNIPPTTPQ